MSKKKGPIIVPDLKGKSEGYKEVRDYHGTVNNYLKKSYTNNEEHQKIADNLMTCYSSEENESKDLASGLDLFNTKKLSRNSFNYIIDKIVQKLETKKGIKLFDRTSNKFTDEGLKYMNNIFNESLDYYNNYLLRDTGKCFIKNRSKKGEKFEFSNTEEIRNFFHHASVEKNTSATRQIHCSILKIVYTINDVKTNEDLIDKASKEFGDIKQNLFFSNFLDYKDNEASTSINNEENNFRYMKLQTKCEKRNTDRIFFNCAGRVKTKEQIEVKEISDPKYNSISAIKDIYGIRNEVKTQEDALFLLEYMRLHVLNKKGGFSHKKIFGETVEDSKDFLEQYRSKLDPEFFNELYKSIKPDNKNGKNNKNYKDVKICGELGGHSCEIQINLIDNKNETGYAHHLIFDAKKKIRALSRLQGYVSEAMIKRYITEAIEKSINEAKRFGGNAELLGLCGYHGPIEKITQDHKIETLNKIFDYILKKEQDIAKLDILGAPQRVNYYTSVSIRDHFHKEGKFVSLYPSGTKVKNLKTNQRTDQAIAA